MSALSLDILGPALVAGLLILATHIPLGAIVLNRGIIFIAMALAQVAALGLAFGNTMWGTATPWAVQICAIAAAIGCALFLTWTDKRLHDVQEAIIGVIYVVAASVQIVILSYSPTGSEYLWELLVGQILRITPTQLLVVGVIYAGALAVWYFRDLVKERMVFYGVLAVVITASIQVVGILVVFASLIIPALATMRAPGRWRLVLAFNIGAAGYLIGLVASALLEISSGAAIVCALTIVAVVAANLIARKPKSAVVGGEPNIQAPRDEIQVWLNTKRAA